MSALVAWIQQLGFLVFFAGLAQILLPDNDLRKVARLVIGLVLILAVIEPVVGWLNGAELLRQLDGGGAAGLLPSGEPHVRRGEELVATAVARVQGEWLAQTERELAALAGLVPGVTQADVTILLAGQGIDGVEVRLAAAGPSSDEGVDEAVEGRVRRLIEGLLPGLSGERIRIVWER